METVAVEAGAKVVEQASGTLSATEFGAIVLLFFVLCAGGAIFFGFGVWRIVSWVGGRLDSWVAPLVSRFMAFLDAMEDTLQKIQATLDRLVVGQQQHGKELVQVHQRLDGIEESVTELKDEFKRSKGE